MSISPFYAKELIGSGLEGPSDNHDNPAAGALGHVE